jgi:hypothetical protein
MDEEPRPAPDPVRRVVAGSDQPKEVKPLEFLAQAATLQAALPTHGEAAADPLIFALARFVEALDSHYPAGPGEVAEAGLAARGNIRRMPPKTAGRTP